MFALAHPTPGAPNVCAAGPGTEPGTDPGTGPGTETPIDAVTWPGSALTRVVDSSRMFLEDSSGLDTQLTDEGVVLWAVDNGEGRFWKLNAQADGTATFAPGWEAGKRARFQRDAANPAAKGPDTEGITVAGDGFLYLASERDNSAKGVNQNTVLKIDPNEPGPDVVAAKEWDVTSILPAVGANLGIEAVEWVADADLAGKLFDENTGAPYDPAGYPGHGDGLFFVAVEDGGQVFALALNDDGTSQRVAELKPRLAGVMALDWDTVRGGLWTVCDDGCSGAAAFFTLDGTQTPAVTHYTRPEGLPNTNNEGFATSPAVPALAPAERSAADRGAADRSAADRAAADRSAADRAAADRSAADRAAAAATAERPAWWFTDGAKVGALRAGTLFTDVKTDPGTENPGTENPGTENPGTETPGTETPGAETPTGTAPGAGAKGAGGSGAGGSGSELAATGAAPSGPGLGALALAVLVAGGGLLTFARLRGQEADRAAR